MSERPAGYARLIDESGLGVPAPRHRSWVRDDAGSRHIEARDARGEVESFPASYFPGEAAFDHLVFALKYDGVDLAALRRIFRAIDAGELAKNVRSMPSSKYARRLFFFYELLTGERLDVGPLPSVRYCEALPSEHYFVAAPCRAPRYRVLDNLLGNARFCPTVRRTERLQESCRRRLDERARRVTADVEPALLSRATWYLYAKETRSSFAIEREEPGSRLERFVEQLGRIAQLDLDTERGLTEVQNALVHARFREPGFRKEGDPEVYVGEVLGFRERVHHVGARSAVVSDMMEGLLGIREIEGVGGAVIEAACKSFGFVFVHPFADGNGRLHRLLLHHTLAKRQYMPSGVVVPVSSVILRESRRYDEVLEDFSRAVLPYVEYALDDSGELTIKNDPDDLYRYPDLTPQCEATFDWLERAVDEDLLGEIEFIGSFDEVRARMRAIVELPDKDEQLFIKLCLQNRGKLSRTKRQRFAKLDDETVARLEMAVQEAMGGLSH